MITNVAKTLDDNSFSFKSSRQTGFCDIILSKSARNMLKLFKTVFFGIYLKCPFRPSIGNIHDCTFVSHQGSKSLDFKLIGKRGEPDSTLGRQGMLTVGGSPSGEYFITTPQFDSKFHFTYRVAGANLLC